MMRPFRTRRRTGRRWPADAGQAMAEAVIMLSLLAFAWVVMTYVLFMANNGIRSATAARHAAWMKGNGLDSQAQAVDVGHWFFDTNYTDFAELSSVANSDGSTASGLFADGSGQWMGFLLGWTPEIRHSRVDFGIDSAADAQTLPFTYMRTQFPFMPPTLMTNMLKVTTHCEWERMDETWDSLGGTLESIMGSLF